MKQSVFVFVIVAAVFVSCWGGDTDEEGLMLPEPAFKNFLLALTWPNQFCSTQKCKPSPPTQQDYFTIHGLWPQETPASSENGCKSNEQFDEKDLASMKEALLKYWPDLRNAKASANFWRREWTKHGTCSSKKYRVKEYFQKSIDLAEKYSARIYQALINKGVKPNGNKYPESDIVCAVRESIGVVPSLGYSSDRQALAEIRLCVKDDAVTLYDCGRKLTFAARPASSASPSQSQSQSRNSTRCEVSSVSEAVHNAV